MVLRCDGGLLMFVFNSLDCKNLHDVESGNSAPIKFAVISAASSGDNTLVAAVTGKKIRVIYYKIVPSADVSVRFESGAGGTALTGVMPLLAEDGVVGPSILEAYCPFGLFQTAASALLNLELSGAVGVYGHLTYCEVT